MPESLINIDPASQASAALQEDPWVDSTGQPQVALLTMPFGYSKFPSIQLGTLSRVLKNQGIDVNLIFKIIGDFVQIDFARIINIFIS